MEDDFLFDDEEVCRNVISWNAELFYTY